MDVAILEFIIRVLVRVVGCTVARHSLSKSLKKALIQSMKKNDYELNRVIFIHIYLIDKIQFIVSYVFIK